MQVALKMTFLFRITLYISIKGLSKGFVFASMQISQELKPINHNQRKTFVNWLFGHDGYFSRLIIFTYNARLTLVDSYTNRIIITAEMELQVTNTSIHCLSFQVD